MARCHLTFPYVLGVAWHANSTRQWSLVIACSAQRLLGLLSEFQC